MTTNDTRDKIDYPTETRTADPAEGRDSNDSRPSESSKTQIGSGDSTRGKGRQAEESSAVLADEKLVGLAQLIGSLEFRARQHYARKQVAQATVYREHADQLHDLVRPGGVE